jgi:RNA 3'-phosphate cyclase
MSVVEIDGSYGEGGGQIVRTACSFAALTQKRCHITNIRLARRLPGLRPQHVASVRALARICGGSLEGDAIGSRELAFSPGPIVVADLHVKLETAASITLMLQALLPAAVAAHRPIAISVEGGGTDTARAPTLDYFRYVFLRFLQRMGALVEVAVVRRGYYPKGGAAMRIRVDAGKPRRLEVRDRGALKEVTLFSQAATVLKARKVAERQVEAALSMINALGITTRSSVEYAPSFSAGSSLCIVAEFADTVIGADALGARGKWAEEVGKEAGAGFIAQFQGSACLDSYMADQILPYLALAGFGSSVTVSAVTSHCRTNMWVIEKFLEGRFQMQRNFITWAAI